VLIAVAFVELDSSLLVLPENEMQKLQLNNPDLGYTVGSTGETRPAKIMAMASWSQLSLAFCRSAPRPARAVKTSAISATTCDKMSSNHSCVAGPGGDSFSQAAWEVGRKDSFLRPGFSQNWITAKRSSEG